MPVWRYCGITCRRCPPAPHRHAAKPRPLRLRKDGRNTLLNLAGLAAPLAWWGLRRWLDNFAYRIDPSPADFVLACAVLLFAAVATISLRAARAARANPVDVLRVE